MKEFIFSLGIIDKKLIWSFLFTITLVIQYIVDNYYPENKKSSTIYKISFGIGGCLIIFIPYILGIKNQNSKKIKQKKIAQNLIYYIIFFYYYCMEFIMV